MNARLFRAVARHVMLAGACLLAASASAAAPAASAPTAGARAHAPAGQVLGAQDRVEPAAQANQPAVQIVEPPDAGMRADAFRVRVVLNPQLIDRRTYKSASVQTYPLQPGPGVYSSYTVASIDDVLKGLPVDVGSYRGPIRVYVSISTRPQYTPGDQVFIAERVSKVTGPAGPVGLSAIRAQDAPASAGSPSNMPRVAPQPAASAQAFPSQHPQLQAPGSSFGSRP